MLFLFLLACGEPVASTTTTTPVAHAVPAADPSGVSMEIHITPALVPVAPKYDPADLDRDGYTPAQGDCDDTDATIHGGWSGGSYVLDKLYDDKDNDCDGKVDEACVVLASDETFTMQVGEGAKVTVTTDYHPEGHFDLAFIVGQGHVSSSPQGYIIECVCTGSCQCDDCDHEATTTVTWGPPKLAPQ